MYPFGMANILQSVQHQISSVMDCIMMPTPAMGSLEKEIVQQTSLAGGLDTLVGERQHMTPG